MRMYSNLTEAAREIERDLYEMGIDVQVQTMQDKDVRDNPDYKTKELRAFGFQVTAGCPRGPEDLAAMVNYVLTGDRMAAPAPAFASVMAYIDAEHADRTGGRAMNPGNAWKERPDLWTQFLHDGKFAYTYSERFTPQLKHLVHELHANPESRQGILTMHTNICPVIGTTSEGVHIVGQSADMLNRGGSGRIPCSMYWQIMIREGAVDLVYTMRSCDFLTHFPVDIALALKLQAWFGEQLGRPVGMFTYFTGSLHAYAKDMAHRGIF